jgi:uncharacterized protein with PIN domain
MAEYIKRDAALIICEKEYKERLRMCDQCVDTIAWHIDNSIKSLPADDAAPVVRCRECKHHYWEPEPCHGKSVHYCKLSHMRGVEVFKDFFCYYGTRKEGAENG